MESVVCTIILYYVAMHRHHGAERSNTVPQSNFDYNCIRDALADTLIDFATCFSSEANTIQMTIHVIKK